MNTKHFSRLVFASIGLAVFPTVGCSQREKAGAALPRPAATEAAHPGAIAASEPTALVPVAVAASPNVTLADWSEIKDCDYGTRARFFVGLKALEARVDDQIGELKTKRAGLKGTTSTREWDLAMTEMGNSRTYLQAMGEESRQATSETWDQRKEKVGQAWVRTQAAFAKVKSSTTS